MFSLAFCGFIHQDYLTPDVLDLVQKQHSLVIDTFIENSLENWQEWCS